jgi:CRP-like cAMP-binding protein
MKNAPKQIDRKTLKILEPLNRLNPILLDELAAKSIIDEIPAGRIICRHGDKDSRQIYLLAGQIEVATAGETKTTVIKSKSALKTPIAEGSPRTVTLKTKTASTLLYIDADLLELLMSDEPELTSAAYEVTEINADDSDDWMLTFLQSPAFLQLPTQNIQKLLTHMEEFPLEKGQTVINQGDKDDFYYIIKSGSCNVHRKPYKDAANVLLAVLQAGSGFGEEALIRNGSRNATITMRENGSLMRLKKADFLALLIEPIISYFAHKDMQNKIDNGCVVIDVRSEQQSNQKPLEASVNIPLSMLRVKFDSLNADREYLLVCDDGSQSAAAAFLMIQSGLKCSVLKKGLNSLKNNNVTNSKAKPTIPAQEATASAKAKEQAAIAKKQTEQIAAQQQQIKAAREKAEQDIIKHKKELAESRARITKKNQHVSSADTKTAQLKDKATKELAKAMAESKAVALQQKETNETMLRAKEVMKQSAAAAEQTRKQAKEEAALIKQTALEEAQYLRAEKASQELKKAQAENEAIKLRQEETNKAMLQAEEIMKQSAIAAEQARKQAEDEAALIKQRAIEEAEHLQAEVETVRQKMEQDAARIKEEEDIIKKSALKIKNEADEIRRIALIDAEQIHSEIEATRALLDEKLQQAKKEEKRNHDAILAKAEERANKLTATKTQQAEAEAIRQKAEEDAIRLHDELKETRKQIEAEAASIIDKLNEQSKEAIVIEEQNVQIIEEEILVELVAEETPARITKHAEKAVDYKAVNIPGLSTIEPLDDDEAKRKAEAIKEKLSQSQSMLKVHETNDGTVLESEDDLFIFKEPEAKATTTQPEEDNFTVAHRTKAETALTQIDTSLPEASKSFVIYPQQEQRTSFENNMFLNQEKSQPSSTNNASQSGSNGANFVATKNVQQFNKQAYMRKHQGSQSNTLAIAASFLLILAGAVFTLHATDTLKVQTIATLFDSGNDTVKPASFAKTKTIRKKVLHANTNTNVKKKVTSKMDDIMQGWKNVLSEAENPKK